MTLDMLVEQLLEVHTNLLKDFLSGIGECSTLDELAERLLQILRKYGVVVLEGIVEALSAEFYENHELRKTLGLRVKERGRTKTVYTIFGNVELRNDIYEDTSCDSGSERRCLSPVLEGLGVKPHQKITDGVQRALVIEALDKSYAKSAAAVADGSLTRKTVHNCVQRTPPVQKFAVPDAPKQVAVLHVYLDEDHIALQRDPAGRKSTTMPVGAVAEGIRKEGKSPECSGRRRLLNPTFFTAHNLKSSALVDEMAAFIETNYDLTALEKVVVHGDGAGWINKALDDVVNTVHAMDGFHLQCELRHFAGRFTTTKRERNTLRRRLEKALEAGDRAAFERIVEECSDSTADQKVKAKCTKFLQFFTKHWGAAAARFDTKSVVVGSCTESIVQHVLSNRMSTDPCSWCRQCAAVIGTWRTAQINGVDLYHLKLDEQVENPYTQHVQELAAQMAAQPLNWDIFDPVPEAFDTNSGTQHLISLIDAGGYTKAM